MAGKAAAKAEPLALTFTLERETKGTHRFQEDNDSDGRPIVGTLYITKEALEANGLIGAKSLLVTIQSAD